MANSTRLSEFVRQVTAVDERILFIKLENNCGFMTVVAIYAPPEDHELRDREQFFHKLDSVVGICLIGNILFVLGDLIQRLTGMVTI